MSLSALLAFALILSVGVATPGPTVLLAMSNGSRYGLRHALVGMLGAVTADVLLVALVGFGLGVLLEASETAFVTLKLLGAAWLAYVGVRMLMSSGGAPVGQAACVPATPDRRTAFLKSFFVAMSNPKYYLFMSALLPQFVDRSHAIAPQYAILAATIVVVDVIGMTGYALLGVHSVRVWKAAGEKWLNRVSGSLLLMLAGYVALYRKASH
ncbi:amino acid transporter [Burkholderia sp. MSh2]|uniref:Amino acid transporter n=1 Tax=Burkholderia paludis TaxID=1506587 RepID=A0A6J5F3K9_9BURK|nr:MULTISPECIES: LysE family translocator [Burkholderia]KEZ02080.1 amino acid transporter [Burkholderia sp. MSh2]KFG93942.1 amino acid transporter [Burkholderia paludis]CAB3773430.1 Homoserine/homoserine lactone efflux protein [Burkholderia paludis]VWC46053.1 amino acid transporter [Burkholderia paludis]